MEADGSDNNYFTWDSDSDDSEGEKRTVGFVNDNLPFIPEWVFGLTCGVGVVTLGGGRICYAAAHFVVVFNYESHTQSLLIGHKNAVTAIASDAARNFLVTADTGSWESYVLLWKNNKWSEPIAKLKPPAPQGTKFVALSQDGKYLITVSEGLRQVVLNLWEISKQMKPDEPSAVLELPDDHGRARAVDFCPDCTEFSMLTCTRNVIFLNWVNGHWTEHYPEQMSHTVGRFSSSVYMSGTAQAATTTDRGFVLIWAEKQVLAQPLNRKMNAGVVKLEHKALTTICEIDKVVVVGDVQGHIRFYDQTFKTLFLWFNLEGGGSILSMSFDVDSEEHSKREVILEVPIRNETSHDSVSSVSIESGPLCVDPRSIRDIKNLRKCLMGPSDLNAWGEDKPITLPFVPADAIVHTKKGATMLVSVQYMRSVTIYSPTVNYTCITTHPSKPHLIIGKNTGEVKVFNYERRESILRTKVWSASISCLRVSPNGHTLMVGATDGTVHFVHPLLINLRSHHGIQRHSSSPVLGPVFSNDGQYMAHFDGDGFVSAYRCLDISKGRWLFLGKKMTHQNTVRTLLFGQEDKNAPLFSLGADRLLVEYDVVHSIGDSLIVKRVDYISAGCISHTMAWCPAPPEFGPSLLISYNECKTNIVNLSDRSSMTTGNGPFFPSPISTLTNLQSFSSRPNTSEGERVAIFLTESHIGLMKVPSEGSPYNTVATFGHNNKLIALAISEDQQYVFTLGENDTNVLMYRINLRALENRIAMSPPGLETYLDRLEGGKTGWMFQEMLHAFCYAQILHQGVKTKKGREITNAVPLCEIPDLIRAVGLCPSQFLLNSILQEVAWKGVMCTGTPGNTITFEDFVKLVVNHYPGQGISLSSIKAAFDEISHAVDENESVMSRDRFISLFTEKGEAFTPKEFRLCLLALLGEDAIPIESGSDNVFFMDEILEREKMFNFLPDDVTYSYLIENILGIDV